MNDMDFQNRVKNLKEQFATCTSKDLIYQKIITFGTKLTLLDEKDRNQDTFVPGCQSQMYIKSFIKDQKVYFLAFSDALISKGLAAILIEVYSGLAAEQILKCKPTFLEELNLLQSLSLNRSNGALSIYTKMQKDALNFLIQKP